MQYFYEKNKDAEEIPCCHFCNSEDVIKFGHQKNKVQRYQCNTCNKTFNERYGTLFYKKHLSDDQILQIVYLFLTGYSIGKMPPMFEVTDYTIRRILREVLLQFQKFKKYVMIPPDYVREVIEIDEVYVKLQGKKTLYGTAKKAMSRRGCEWTAEVEAMWNAVFEMTSPVRKKAIKKGRRRLLT